MREVCEVDTCLNKATYSSGEKSVCSRHKRFFRHKRKPRNRDHHNIQASIAGGGDPPVISKDLASRFWTYPAEIQATIAMSLNRPPRMTMKKWDHKIDLSTIDGTAFQDLTPEQHPALAAEALRQLRIIYPETCDDAELSEIMECLEYDIDGEDPEMINYVLRDLYEFGDYKKRLWIQTW